MDWGAWNVILAVPAPEDRIRILEDQELFSKLLSIKEGSIVRVVETSTLGIVVNVDFRPELGAGIYFDVEPLVSIRAKTYGAGVCNTVDGCMA